MLEILTVYFSWWPLYPVATLGHFVDAPFVFSGWLVCALAGLAVLTRAHAYFIRKVWVASMLMPATIICGSWALVPWPLGVVAASGSGGCSTLPSLVICVFLNLALVFIVAYTFSLWRRRVSAV